MRNQVAHPPAIDLDEVGKIIKKIEVASLESETENQEKFKRLGFRKFFITQNEV